MIHEKHLAQHYPHISKAHSILVITVVNSFINCITELFTYLGIELALLIFRSPYLYHVVLKYN